MRSFRQGIFLFAALIALSATIAFAGNDAAPSFDCAKASSPDEKAICADPELAAIGAAASKGADQPMPKALGQCALTHIAALTTRLGEDLLEGADPSAGSLVQFANDRVQVSYDRDYGLANSQVGDAVVVCLMAITERLSAGRRTRPGLLRRRPQPARQLGAAGLPAHVRRRMKRIFLSERLKMDRRPKGDAVELIDAGLAFPEGMFRLRRLRMPSGLRPMRDPPSEDR